MKQVERIILSILRRPIKTIILVGLVFVMANVISGSIILYNSTQSLKENIQNKISPTIMFDTGFDIYDNTLIFKDKTITQEDEDTYYKVFKPNYSYENVMNQFDSFQKIKEFDEVKTGSVTLLDLYVTTKEKINFYSTHYNYEFYEDWLHASKSRSVVGIEPEYNYLFDKKIIDITEGRKLNSNEKYGIILYKGLSFLDNQGNRTKVKIGDTITLVNYIFDIKTFKDEYLDRHISPVNEEEYQYFVKSGKVEEMNKWYESLVLYEKEYKFEVVGFYDDYGFVHNTKNSIQPTNIGLDTNENGYYMIIPQETFLEIQDDYENAYQNLKSEGHEEIGEIRGFNENYIYILNNYFELNSSDNIESVVSKADKLFDKYGLNVKKLVNNDLYLKIAGPLDGINSLSKLLLGVGIGVSIIILSCLSIIFIKERRKEIGMLLSMGEGKKNIIKQLILEMSIVCLIGISTSLFTSNMFAGYISDSLINNSDYKVELSEEEKLMIDEEYSTVKVMNEYEEILESNNILIVSSISLGICLLSTSISALYILKMNPKEILM